jgi:cysteinyl-tRNA synthetase
VSLFLPVGAVLAMLVACAADLPAGAAPKPGLTGITTFTYVLQNYPKGRLKDIERAPHQLAIIDLSRYSTAEGYFTAAEIARVRGSGKRVLAYFEIGSIETFRTEYRPLRAHDPDLLLNVWADWPDERFVKYWDERWWLQVVNPRVDQALRAGFDGVYLDTPLAYEEIDLARVPGETRARLGRKMADLVIRISAYAKGIRPGFAVVPQNSPELRRQRGYTRAIDGIGMEELFFRDTDVPCRESWCGENLADTLALRKQGKAVFATDYARSPANVRTACSRYREYGLAGNVTVVDLDRVSPPCK